MGPTSIATLVELLRHWAEQRPAANAYTFLADGEVESVSLSYAELDRKARAIAAHLQAMGAEGERALLLYPAGLDFVPAFFGCLYAGVTAVPAYPPRRHRLQQRLRSIAEDCRPAVILTTAAIGEHAGALSTQSAPLGRARWLATDDLAGDTTATEAWPTFDVRPETLAFLQYTSGSTGSPKGVMVSHENLLHNEEMIRLAFGQDESSVVVGWLPLYHDMGLIGNVLQPLYAGARCVLMSPMAFLQKPARWLQAIDRYRGTTSGGPNFAYELCVERIRGAERDGLDLSSWRVAFNGAEPVHAATLERFAAAFGPQGFRREAFYPCYGLAEATLLVSGGEWRREPAIRAYDAAALEGDHAVRVDSGADGARTLVGCGHPWLGQELLIVDPASRRRRGAGEVGEIWIGGPSVAGGYWGQAELSRRDFAAHLADEPAAGTYLRTGDLGFHHAGELFVTGRLKDLIIIRGRNLYPHDLERTAEASHPALRAGCSAAFSVDSAGQEQLVLVLEVERRAARETSAGSVDRIAEAVRRAVAEEHEVAVGRVVLIHPATLPKTSSGKVRRRACRRRYLASELRTLGESELGAEIAGTERDAGGAEPLDRQALARLDLGERRRLLTERLRRQAARQLGIAPERLPTTTPLTALGLDSVRAMTLRGQMEKELGHGPELADLLGGASLAEIVEPILDGWAASDEDGETRSGRPVPALRAEAEVVGDHPLSHGQRGLWFLQRLAPESAAYNIAAAARIHGSLDVGALRRAFEHLVARHPVLRGCFREIEPGGDDGSGAPSTIVEVVQRIGPTTAGDLSFHFEEGDAWEEEEDTARESLDEYLAAEAHRPFDLATGPLLRVRVLRRGDGEHVLLLVVHHIVADFWSITILLEELGELYRDLAAGRPPALPPREHTYADFVRWQRERLAGDEGRRLETYWLEALSGDLEPLALSSDHPRPAVQTWRGGAEAALLPLPLLDDLRVWGEEHGATVYMTLLAGFQTLLHRHTGQDRIAVGSPTAGRPRPELENLVGYFVNPLVMRGDFSAHPTASGFLRQLRHTVLDAFRHDAFPFELLVERLQPRQRGDRSPIFQALFTLQQAPRLRGRGLEAFALAHGAPGGGDLGGGARDGGARLVLGGLEWEPFPLATRAAQFELSLAAAVTGQGLALSLTYNRDLFAAVTAQRMLGHLRRVLEGMVTTPDVPLDALDLLTVEESRQLAVWNGTGAEAPREISLLDLIAAQVRRTPKAPALSRAGIGLSYGELWRRAGRLGEHLAERLRESGAGPEPIIGLCFERSLDLVVAMLGVLRAGAAYAPLDPAYPDERLAFVLEDCAALVVLVDRAHHSRIAALGEGAGRHGARVLVLEDLSLDEGPLGSGDGPWDPERLAYLIYTSGSTGRPKGVAIRQGAAGALARWAAEAFPAELWGGVLAATSINFDLSIFEIFVPLTLGGEVLVAENALELPRLAERERVTLVNTVPSAMAELVRGDELPASLRAVILAGEPLRRGLVDAVHRAGSAQGRGLRVYNYYGPSEDTTYSTGTEVAAGEPGEPTIGRPIAGTRVQVLDRHGRPVPPGVVGELYLAGQGLARGYLGRPGLTAERFVPDASATDGGRQYRTGDLVRWSHAGELLFLGRRDLQVKVRGFRIELGEIEAALLRQPAVAEAVVMALALPHRAGEEGEADAQDRRLVAWITLAPSHPGGGEAEDGREAPTEELRHELERALPTYMVPQAILVLDALPLLPNGKVDRRALPEPSWASGEAELAPPATSTEEALAEIWREVLGVESIARDDDFFALGGHSLLATRTLSRLRERTGLELAVRDLFRASTLRGLARVIDEAQRNEPTGPMEGKAAAPAFELLPRTGPFPLSSAQERLWFLDRLNPGETTYNMPAAVRLRGRLDLAAFGRSLGTVIQRHESLRTTFVDTAEGPRQEVRPAIAVLAHTDLSALSTAARESELRSRLDRETRRPFDLTLGPPLRARLFRLDADEHVLLVDMHHIISDAWSFEVLLRELTAAYTSLTGGVEPPLAPALLLPPLEAQPADFAHWQRRWLESPELERQLDFWRRQLAGATPLELPTDRPRPAEPSHRGSRARRRLPAELVADLDALITSGRLAAGRVTRFQLLLAGFAALLRRYTWQQDITLGTAVAGRRERKLEGLIGFFVNTLLLRFDLGGQPDFRQLVERVREVSLGADAHQDAPFPRVVQELGLSAGDGTTPLLRVLFLSAKSPLGALCLPGLSATRVEIERPTAKFDLTLLVEEEGEGELVAELEYATDLFDATTADRLLRLYERLLAAAVAEPHRSLDALPLLDAGDRASLLSLGRGAEVRYPRDSSIHGRFHEIAERLPEAIAVVDEADQLSYGELSTRSRRLAHRLRAAGVGPEDPVALLTGRGAGMVVAILAILRAGGHYVPLDPSYPAERLRLMMRDAGARFLLSSPAAEEKSGGLLALNGVQRLSLATEASETGKPETESPETAWPEAGAAALAYVMFTSGSTGRPKGVMVSHRNVLRLVLGNDYIAFGPERVFLHAAPPSFDASTLEIWGPLLHGGRLVSAPSRRLSLAELGRVIRRGAVDTLWLTAGLFHQMVDSQLEDLGGVTHLLAGGDVLALPQVRRVLEDRPGRWMINGYGPTEGTTFTTTCVMTLAADLDGRAAVPIGRPLAHTRVLLLNPTGVVSPPGVPGHLHLGGDGVARGYSRQPALTAERFVPDPTRVETSGEGGQRLYATGDLARWLPDGRLEFRGRIDHQVKVRGFRVEPGEIESILAAVEGVARGVVVARQQGGAKRLVAYLVAAADVEPDTDRIRAAVAERLPEPLRPSLYVWLDELPLGATGKVDRAALPEPGKSGDAAPDAARGEELKAAPATPTEEKLAELWKEVLGTEAVGGGVVGRDDDFFQLGGHSLSATQLLSRLRATAGVEIPLRRIFEAPTLRAMAWAVDAARLGDETPLALPPIEAIDRGYPSGSGPVGQWPTSFAQERLWFLDRLHPGRPTYSIPAALLLSGRLNLGALVDAFVQLVERHEALRTTFAEVKGQPRQVIHRRLLPAIEVVDLRPKGASSGVPEREGSDREAQHHLRAFARRAFDLATGPLLRVLVLRLASERHVLGLNLHHIIADGWSTGVLIGEVATLYTAAAPLPRLPIQVVDHAVWQRRYLTDEALAAPLAELGQRLAEVPSLALPHDRPRPARPSGSGTTLEVRLDAPSTTALRGAAQRAGTTLFTAVLTAWGATLSCAAGGQSDFAIGVPVANRNREETEGLIGCLVNTLALRLDFSGDPSFHQLLARAHEVVLDADRHQDIPLERLINTLPGSRDLASPPLFQTVLAFQNTPRRPIALGDLEVKRLPIDTATAKFDLTLSLSEEGEPEAPELVGTLELASELFDRRTGRELWRRFQQLARAAVARPEQSLAQLGFVSVEQRQRLAARSRARKDDEASRTELREVTAALPATPAEVTLAALWREVLGVERVDRNDDFFILGGHSLLATRLVSEIRHAFGIDLPLTEVFDHSRLADLAAVLERGAEVESLPAEESTGAPPAPVPVPRRRGESFSLSYAQERLWILDRLEPGNAAYTIPGAVRLSGSLRPALLRRAVGQLIGRHESLRTTFHAEAGRPTQRIAERTAIDVDAYFTAIDLSLLSADARQREVARQLAADLARPFDLQRGPLLRLRWLRCSEIESALLITVHHIVADGWSMSLITRELGWLYHAERAAAVPGSTASRELPFVPELPELPVQYVDIAVWQRRWLRGAELERQLGYWRRQLEGMPQALELPTDRQRPAVRRYRGGRVSQRLDTAVHSGVNELARELGATPFMVLFSAFALLLGRLAGQDDFGIGIPLAGRQQRETAGVIGMFLNTLVLRAELAGAPSFVDLVGRVRASALDAFAHQELPFERLLEEIKPRRDLSRSPLFQVFFNLLNLPSAELELPELEIEPMPTPVAPSKFDLTVYLHQRDDHTELEWVYDADLFLPERMEIMASQFGHLLRQGIEAPERSIVDFDLRPPMRAEESPALPDPMTPLDGSWMGSAQGIFQSWAEREGDRLAVADPHTQLSYRQLADDSHRLAHALLATGLERGGRVAIWAHRSTELVAAVLGTLFAGGTFVILDPSYPGDRLAAVVRRARPWALLRLTARGDQARELAMELPGELAAALEELGTARLDLGPEIGNPTGPGGGRGWLASFPATDPGIEVGPDDIAYLAFTSGSTGEPKGILGRHGSLSHFHPFMARRFAFSPDQPGASQRFAMLSGLAHDPLHRDIFTPLANGGSIHIPDPRQILSSTYLAQWLEQERVEVAVMTPAMSQVLAEGGEIGERRVRSLRWIFLVGDVLSRRDVERLERLAPHATCVNLYGSTETQRAVAFYESPPGNRGRAEGGGKEILPLGRGMRDVQLLVLASGARLAGVGELGEICVRSPHLAAGYLEDPEETARRFVTNPFTGDAVDRLYRTGDLGRYLPSGAVVFAGRADQQVKVRGFRIELGEIEAHLGRFGEVAEAVVLATSAPAPRQLIAYVVARPDTAITETQLRQQLRERVPSYMVPAAFVLLERLPLTPNGKIDRRALAEIQPASPERDMAYRAPQTEMEKTLAGILREVLGKDRVGIEDNFFDLGGTSLNMVQVHHQIEETTGIAVMPVELFNHPTVAALAAYLHHLSSDGSSHPVAEAPEEDRSEQLARGRDRLMRIKSRRRAAS